MNMKYKNNLLTGAASLVAAVILTKFLGVFFKVPLSYVLTDEGMGYFNFSYSIYSFFYILCTAGVSKAITLLVSENAVNNDMENAKESVKQSISLFAKIGAFVTLFIIICAPATAYLLGNSKAVYTLLTIAPSIFFVSVSGVLRGYMNAVSRLADISLSQLVEAGLKLLLGLLLAFMGMRQKLPLYLISALSVLGITIGSAVSCLYLLIRSKLYKTNNKTRQTGINTKFNIGKILSVTVPISLGSSILNLTNIFDMGLIIRSVQERGYTEAEANALYGNYTTLAVPMLNLVIALITPITLAYLPILARHNLARDNKSFTNVARRLLIFTNFISVASSCAFFFYSFEILDILFSVHSAAVGAQMLTYLSAGVMLLSALTVTNTILEAKGKVIHTVISLMIGSIVKCIVSFILMYKTDLGILGAPIGTVFSYLVSLAISVYILDRNGVKIKIFIITLISLLFGILSFIFPYIFIYTRVILLNSFVTFVICAFLSSVFCCLMHIPLFVLKTRKV